MKKEFRFLTQELRAAGDGKPKISGYAAKYNAVTELQPGLREIIRPGAFGNTVANEDPCYCCFNHDQEKIISRTESGTLRLKEDERGLWFDSDIDLSVSYASDLYRNIKNGNVSECSFGFYVVRENYANQKDGSILRELLEVRCFDVSPVIQPQYSGGVTSVSARSMFPEGMPTSVEMRSKLIAAIPVTGVSDRDLALMRCKLELLKRK